MIPGNQKNKYDETCNFFSVFPDATGIFLLQAEPGSNSIGVAGK